MALSDMANNKFHIQFEFTGFCESVTFIKMQVFGLQFLGAQSDEFGTILCI